MSALSIQPTFPIFTETNGQPLENGYIFLGAANLNPQTNPIAAFFDAALTISAVQPIRTQNGYPVYQGTPARIYVNSDYSIQVQNKNGSVVYSAPAATERYSSELITFIQTGIGAVQLTAQNKMRENVSVKDFGAVGNGVVDDTVAIQTALDSGAKGVFIPTGDYLITASIDVPNLINVQCSTGVKIIFNSTDFYALSMGYGVNFVGNGILIDCVNPAWNGGAIFIDGFNRYAADFPASFDGINVKGADVTKGTGLFLTSQNATNYISFVRFSNFSFYNLNFGATLNAGSSGIIGDNTTWHWINGNVFENFVFYGTRNGILLEGLPGVPAEVAGNVFSNFEFQVGASATNFPIYVSGASFNTFSNAFIWDWNFALSNPIIFANSATNNQVVSSVDPAFVTTNGINIAIQNGSGIVSKISSLGDIALRDTSLLKIGFLSFEGTIGGTNDLVITPRPANTVRIGSTLNPTVDNSFNLGAPALRWATVFATTGAINTSDENEKQDIAPISDAVLRAWSKVEFYQFKFKDAVEKKGDDARIHIGLMAQRIKSAFESEGLDPFSYGLLCFDQWDDQFEGVVVAEKYIDENGKGQTRNVMTEEKHLVLAAGSRYGIRYEQALTLECAYLRSKITGV